MRRRAGSWMDVPERWPLWTQYAVAVSLAAGAVGSRVAFQPVLGSRVTLQFLWVVLVPLVWLVRSGPFAAATVVGLGLTLLLVESPSGRPLTLNLGLAVHLGLALFMATGLGLSARLARAALRSQQSAEAALAEHNRRLEDEVRARAAELEASHARARAVERLAAIGSLAAGLGHDLSNLLLPMKIRLQCLSEGLGAGTEAQRSDLEAIEAAVEYLEALAGGLRMLSRDPDAPRAEAATADLRTWWVRVRPLLRAVLVRGVRLEGDEPRLDEPVVAAMPAHQLTQVVFNLVQNAGEALADAGTPDPTVRVSVGPVGGGERRMVRVTVRDNGPGMPDDVRRRCMEPNFSTKHCRSHGGVGGGMGLAMARELVERAGGTIDVASAPGCGAEFSVTLPCVPIVVVTSLAAGASAARA